MCRADRTRRSNFVGLLVCLAAFSWLCASPSLLVHSLSIDSLPPPPLIRGTYDSWYTAGLYHGVQAADRITAWAEADEIVAAIKFVSTGAGQQAFLNMKRDNTAAFPNLVENLQGISDGSKVPLDTIWVINLISEIENLMPPSDSSRADTHCSDIYASVGSMKPSSDVAVPSGTRADLAALWSGHNEDWSQAVRPFVYFLAETVIGPGDTSSSCGGYVYPGALLGSAFTFNNLGIYYTQNSLFPNSSRSDGLGSNFVNRWACSQSTLEGVIAASILPNQTLGFSLNVIDLNQRRLSNLEIWEDQSAEWDLPTPRPGGGRNGSHFNAYKHMQPIPPQNDPSSINRQSTADSFPPPRSDFDILAILGDTSDPVYPIYKPDTIVTALMNGLTGDLTLWYATNPKNSAPIFHWNIYSFWNNSTKSESIQ